MTITGFIQPTDSTQALHDEIAALREQRQGVTDPTERQRLNNEIGRLSDQVRKVRADEQRQERAVLILRMIEEAKKGG